MRRLTALVTSAALAASVLVGVGLAAAPEPAQALSGADFDPGYIVSDQVFFNGGAMNEGQIQQFLDAQIGSCTNTNCMNVKRTDTATRGADAMCGTYQGAGSESVARIIAKVGAACGINPQVLLVTLQKEQGLISGSAARGPSDARVERAMGYACPDSANGGCDPTYAGVYNQIYRAAWQFKRYANPAGTSNYFQQYAPGANRTIQYNPSAACGSKTVFVRNQATANLYYYTPYTPNAAALANLSGTGDACSAYGNRNFWVYFNSWFGSPTGTVVTATGNVEAVTAGVGTVSVSGWALDRTTSASIPVHVYVGAVGTPVTAAFDRPDVAATFPGSGSRHGFSVTLPASPGPQQVCVYAIGNGVGNTPQLGCRTVDVRDPSPVGTVEAVRAAPGGLEVSGWAFDWNTTASILVHVYVDGVGRALVADRSRADVARAYPGQGAAHGYSASFVAGPGDHQVCIYGINTGAGQNRLFECRTVTVMAGSPVGAFDAAQASDGRIAASGWALDPDTRDAVDVHVYVDGVGRAVKADVPRSDIGRIHPGYGAAHGWSSQVAATPGRHEVCAYAINVGAGATTVLGCKTVVVENRPPVGAVDVVRATSSGVAVSGWALDPDEPATSMAVHVYVGARGTALTANTSRSDIARIFPGAGAAHGFEAVVAAPSGVQDVCVYAIDTRGGVNPQLTCRTVTVP